MQTLTWYAKRLRRMSPREMAWRARGMVRDGVDRPRIAFGLVPASLYDTDRARSVLAGAVPLCGQPAGCWRDAAPGSTEAQWRDRLLRRARAYAEHRFSFFNLENRHLGDPIDWNRDHETGAIAPGRFAPSIDYRDLRVTGDAKVVWEPGRHQQLVVLGRAYRASGDAAFARELVAQIESWLDQCPFGRGMHWRSPLELAIRVINWVWAIDLIRGAGVLEGAAAARVLNALHLHVWEIARKYSRGSSANNHRIGEAAGVFIAASCLPGLAGAARWRGESRAILEDEIVAQTYADGASREQAFGYHVFVLQFLALAAVVAERSGAPFSAVFHDRLRRMFDFAAAMCEGGPPSWFGDYDDGYVADFGGNSRDPREWLALGERLLERSDREWIDAEYGETAWWMVGDGVAGRGAAGRGAAALASKAFADSGRYLLQHGGRGDAAALSVTFDCGEFGFGAIAAHGHADALAFTLRAFGIDVLVDPGTYDYFSFPEWREYFRSTRAHNTIEIDGREQSVPAGPFMWGARANAWCTAWEPRAGGGRVQGAHDGYERLEDPVRHTRTLDLDGPSRALMIADRLEMRQPHQIAMYFHFSEHCEVRAADGVIEAVTGRGSVRLEPDARLAISLMRGSTAPISGWVSDGYHRKAPATTVRLTGTLPATTLSTRITVGPAIGRH
ncbi:MAG TPA: alginate lyase family protein [Vicinamibacterales bacterium]|nr:alginate lyase family protein [Vicinamibacterales bacterium]